MRHAEWIANRLLEAVPQRPPSAPRGAVYVLSGNTGQQYPSMQAYAAKLAQVSPEQMTDEMVRKIVDGQINRGVVIFEQPDYGKLTVYAKGVPVPVSTEQMDQMQHRFHVIYQPYLAFARSTRMRPSTVSFDDVFASRKAMDQQLRAKEKLSKQAEKADKDLAKQEPQSPGEPSAVRRGIETERGSWFNPPGWREEFKQEYGKYPEEIETGYKDAATPEQQPPQQNPYELGIEYDQRYRQRGVLIARISPDGPAAASVLRAGDIVRQVGPFETRSGVVAGPYRVDKVSDLERTLSWLRKGTAFPMKVVRGSGYVDVVIMPRFKSNAPTA